MRTKFQVGQRVWEFDEGCREYHKDKDKDGYPLGAPIYEKHFKLRWVVGIEGRSYLISNYADGHYSYKIGFAKAEKLYYTDEGKVDQIWDHDYRNRIVNAVDRVDVAMLRRVAELIGWKDSKE